MCAARIRIWEIFVEKDPNRTANNRNFHILVVTYIVCVVACPTLTHPAVCVCVCVCCSHICLQINFVSRWKFIWILKFVRHAHSCFRSSVREDASSADRRHTHTDFIFCVAFATWLKDLFIRLVLNHIIVVCRRVCLAKRDGFVQSNILINLSTARQPYSTFDTHGFNLTNWNVTLKFAIVPLRLWTHAYAEEK